MNSGFEKYGFKIGYVRHFSPKEAFEASKQGAVFLDVRQPYETEYKSFGVEKLIYIPHEEIEEKYEDLPKDRFLVVADSVGLHSKEVLEFLKEKGFTMLANLNGGIHDWELDALPILINKNERLTGSCACMLKPREKKQF